MPEIAEARRNFGRGSSADPSLDAAAWFGVNQAALRHPLAIGGRSAFRLAVQNSNSQQRK